MIRKGLRKRVSIFQEPSVERILDHDYNAGGGGGGMDSLKSIDDGLQEEDIIVITS